MKAIGMMARQIHAEHAVATSIQVTLKTAWDEGKGTLLRPDLVNVFAHRAK